MNTPTPFALMLSSASRLCFLVREGFRSEKVSLVPTEMDGQHDPSPTSKFHRQEARRDRLHVVGPKKSSCWHATRIPWSLDQGGIPMTATAATVPRCKRTSSECRRGQGKFGKETTDSGARATARNSSDRTQSQCVCHEGIALRLSVQQATTASVTALMKVPRLTLPHLRWCTAPHIVERRCATPCQSVATCRYASHR